MITNQRYIKALNESGQHHRAAGKLDLIVEGGGGGGAREGIP